MATTTSRSTTSRSPLSYLTDQMNELRQKGTHFSLRVLEDEQAPECTVDGKQVINLASNNYLGLTTHPKLREAAIAATKKYGVGAGAVRTVSGTMTIHMELEEKIARFKQTEAAVVFQSGFTANAGTVSAILGKDDFIISDELNHASIIDGARLSRAKIKVFRHKDLAHAEELLKEVAGEPGHKLLITDGVFSMDGDIGPLPALCDLAEKYGAIMMIDDAHPSVAATCIAAFDVLEQEPERIDRLWGNTRFFKKELGLLGFNIGGQNTPASETPITPVIVGEGRLAMDFSRELFDAGVFTPGIAFPTVPEGKARLRTIMSATHTQEQLSRALDILKKVG